MASTETASTPAERSPREWFRDHVIGVLFWVGVALAVQMAMYLWKGLVYFHALVAGLFSLVPDSFWHGAWIWFMVVLGVFYVEREFTNIRHQLEEVNARLKRIEDR